MMERDWRPEGWRKTCSCGWRVNVTDKHMEDRFAPRKGAEYVKRALRGGPQLLPAKEEKRNELLESTNLLYRAEKKTEIRGERIEGRLFNEGSIGLLLEEK